MAVGKITADTVNALTPGASDFFLWDDKLAGFGVKVTPKGAKVYVLQYRMGGRGSKVRRYTIGTENPWRPKSARDEAERLLRLVKQGTDVAAAAKDRRKVAVELAFTPFVKQFAETTLKAKWPKSWKQSKACLDLHACGHWGNKPLPDITAADVRSLLKRLDDRPATRRNLFACLSFLFNQAVRDGTLAESPLLRVEAPAPVDERTRVLNDDELRWLWTAIDEEAAPYDEVVRDLILLGQRRGEVAGMPWSELNRDRGEWHLPAARAKNGCENIIPLTDAMIARFDKLAGGSRWPRSGLVFPSRNGTALSGWSKMKRRLDASMRKAAKEVGGEVAPWKLHDLRRTLATYMQRLGVTHETIEHLLNHKEKARSGIAKVYQTHDYKPEKRAALERWETELGRIVASDPVVVVPLRRA